MTSVSLGLCPYKAPGRPWAQALGTQVYGAKQAGGGKAKQYKVGSTSSHTFRGTSLSTASQTGLYQNSISNGQNSKTSRRSKEFFQKDKNTEGRNYIVIFKKRVRKGKKNVAFTCNLFKEP